MATLPDIEKRPPPLSRSLHCPDPRCQGEITTVVKRNVYGTINAQCPRCKQWRSFVIIPATDLPAA